MGSQSHKRRCLYAANLKEKKSVDSKFTRSRVSKLLIEVEIDLGLNLIVKTSIIYSGFFYLEDS